MATIFQLNSADFLELYASGRAEYDRDAVTAEEYWTSFAQNVGTKIDWATINQIRYLDALTWSKVNTTMVRWLAMLHAAGVQTALLSNMELDGANYARDHHRWLSYLDHIVFSCDIKLIKPDHAIFRECLCRLGVEPHEALFVDDKNVNVVAAESLGIKAIQFESVTQLSSQLQKAGFWVLPGDNNTSVSIARLCPLELHNGEAI